MAYLLTYDQTMVELWNSIPWESVNWGDVPTWLTGLLAAPAVVFAGWQVGVASRQNKITAKQEERAARQEEDSHRPIVIATLELSSVSMQLIEFHVRNVGQGPAYDVKFEFLDLPDISPTYTKSLFWEVNYLKNGIPVMGPGETRTNLADLYRNRNSEMKDEGRVRISYRSVNGREYSDDFTFSFDAHQGLRQVGIKTTHDMVRALESIDKTLGK